MNNNAYDFYAFWNGEAVADLWTIIAAMTSTDDYRVLLTAVILLGFLISMLSAAIRNRGTDALIWFATTIVILSLAFVPRVTITVKDVRAGFSQAVENIPIGIAWPASLTSRLSWWMTNTFETAFNDVDAAKFSQFGVAFPQRAVSAVLAMGAVTEEGREAVRAFSERCILPEILDNPTKRQALMNAPDITALVASKDWVNPARRVLIGGDVLTCQAALPRLTSILETVEIPAVENTLVSRLDVSGNDITNESILAALPGAEECLLGVSRTLTQSLKQSIMLSALPETMLSSAAKAGKAPLTTGVAIARAQGNLASEINYRALADMAKSALPKIRNILEFVVIALFPIVFVLIVGMGTAGFSIARSYMTLLISVGLWAPITAIINYLTIHVDAETINRLVDASGGVTLATATLIREAGASSQAIAGSLLWLVPILAYAVAKGSDIAVTQMASSVLAPASSAAQAQGSSIAMGNVSAGNASVGNVSANNATGNKTDFSSSYTAPDKHVSTTAFGTYQGSMSTGAVTAMSVARTDLGIDTSGTYSRSVENVRTESNATNSAFNQATMRNDSTSHTSGSSVTDVHGTTVTSAQTTAHTDSSSFTTSSNYSTTDGIGNTATLTRSGSSTESISVNSGGGVMLNSAYRDSPSISTAPIEGDIPNSNSMAQQNIGSHADLSQEISSTAIANPITVGNALTGKNKTSLPNGAGLNQNLLTNSVNVNSHIGTTANAGMSDNTSLGVVAQSSKNINTSQMNAEQRSGMSQNQITTGDQSTISHLQSTNLSTLKSDGTRMESSSSHEHREGRNFSNVNGASTRTGVDMSLQTRDEALRIFGSPEAALESLSSSTSMRMSLGRHMRTLSDSQTIRDDISSNADHDFPIGELESRALHRAHKADSAGVQAAGELGFDQVRASTPVRPGVMRTFKATVPEGERNLIYWNRGLTIASAAHYQQDETGALSVASRSYLFGLTYSSPQQFYNDLKTRSAADPEFKSALIELGRDFSADVDKKTIETSEILDRLERKDRTY